MSSTQEPQGRVGHTANLMDQKLYFLGGLDLQNKPLLDFFYLDLLTQNFINSDLTFYNVSINQTNPGVSFGSAGVANQSSIFLIGGLEVNVLPSYYLDYLDYIIFDTHFPKFQQNGNSFDLSENEYSFDINNNSRVWDSKNISTGQGPSSRRSFTAPIDKKGVMYAYGGSNQTQVAPTSGNADTTMYKLDTTTGNWTQAKISSNLSIAQLPSFEYSATFLDNVTIVYIGGKSAAGNYQNMNRVG